MRYPNVFGAGEIDSLPGCSQIAVIHSAFVDPEMRNKGYGRSNNTERLNKCHDLGYDMALCTVDLSNKNQLKILKKNGWMILTKFKSRKTGHTVGVFAHGIGQKLEENAVFPMLYDVSASERYYSDYVHPDGLQ